MAYTKFDRICDEAVFGASFSRRTRLIVWTAKRTWWLWRRSERAKYAIAWLMGKSMVRPRG